MNKLPIGWTLASVADLGQIVTGSTPSTKDASNWGGHIPFVTPGDMEHLGKISTTERTVTEMGAARGRLLPPGSVLVTCIGNLGRTAIAANSCVSNQQINAIVPAAPSMAKYITFACGSPAFRAQLERVSTSTTVTLVNKSNFGRLLLPVAPLREQERIAAAIEEKFSLLDAGATALGRVQQNLRRMRAAVLQAGVTGQLVPQDLNDEPASAWMETYSKSCNGEVSGLPPGWARTTIGELKIWSLYGPRFTSDDYVASGVPVLRTTDITSYGRIRVDQAPKLALSKTDLQKYHVMPGDILVTRTGSIGTVAFIAEDRPAIPGAYLILYRFGLPIVFSEFLFFLFQAPHIQRQLIGKSAGIGRPNLNAPSIDATVVDVPPFAEAVRIVDEVKRLLSSIEKLEADLQVAKAREQQLRLSILAAAFSGQLVPQDPMDEPASVLLERIGAEWAASNGQQPRQRRVRLAYQEKVTP